MWQAVVVALVIAAALFYLIRHYLRAFRGGAQPCSCCSSRCTPEQPFAGNDSECEGISSHSCEGQQ